MLITKSKLKNNTLINRTILVTGAGGGIGYETARALVWMGANVIIAEINKEKGQKAEKTINEEMSCDRAVFYHIDISKKEQIEELYTYVKNNYGVLFAIINNATITFFGSVDSVSINDWDNSYAVNLRAPILLTQMFLPDMKEKNEGIIVFIPSSGAAPFMGAYEIFKTAQVELSNTLYGELDKTNIYTYSIGPGLVKTETAQKGIEQVASLMNISTKEFYEINESHMLDVESAGVGFAASLIFASKYNGQEIGSIQALIDCGLLDIKENKSDGEVTVKNQETLKNLFSIVHATYNEQYQGWLKRNIFERQWVLRDFKKQVNLSSKEIKDELDYINLSLNNNKYSILHEKKILFTKLIKYYQHQYKMLQQYEKSPTKLKEHSDIIISWVKTLQDITDILS